MSTAVEVSATALEKPLGMRKNGMSMLAHKVQAPLALLL